jgi:hypothetical protein
MRPFALALLVAASPVFAQTVLVPGSPDLVPAEIQAEAEYEIRMLAPQEQSIGTVRAVERIEDGRLVMVSHIQIPMAGQNQADSTVVAWPSLAPYHRTSDDGTEQTVLNFSDGTASGQRVLGNLEEDLSMTYTTAQFSQGTGRRIVRSLPFAEGYQATFETIKKDGETGSTSYTVTGQETFVHTDGTEHTLWLVDGVDSDGDTTVYGVDADTRSLMVMRFSPAPGYQIEMVTR